MRAIPVRVRRCARVVCVCLIHHTPAASQCQVDLRQSSLLCTSIHSLPLPASHASRAVYSPSSTHAARLCNISRSMSRPVSRHTAIQPSRPGHRATSPPRQQPTATAVHMCPLRIPPHRHWRRRHGRKDVHGRITLASQHRRRRAHANAAEAALCVVCRQLNDLSDLTRAYAALVSSSSVSSRTMPSLDSTSTWAAGLKMSRRMGSTTRPWKAPQRTMKRRA